MDPVRVAVRCVFAFLVLLALVRLAGKRTIVQGSPFEFTTALIVGDIVDNAIWAEVPAAQFVVAAVVLVASHVAFDYRRYRAGCSRQSWNSSSSG